MRGEWLSFFFFSLEFFFPLFQKLEKHQPILLLLSRHSSTRGAMIRIRAASVQSVPSPASAALSRSPAPSRQGPATFARSSLSSKPPSSTPLAAACRPARPARRPASTSFRKRRTLALRVSAVSSSTDRNNQEPTAAAVGDSGDSEAVRWRWEDSQDAVVAYGVLAAVLAAGAAASALDVPHASLPYFVGLVSWRREEQKEGAHGDRGDRGGEGDGGNSLSRFSKLFCSLFLSTLEKNRQR